MNIYYLFSYLVWKGENTCQLMGEIIVACHSIMIVLRGECPYNILSDNEVLELIQTACTMQKIHI